MKRSSEFMSGFEFGVNFICGIFNSVVADSLKELLNMYNEINKVKNEKQIKKK